jgi:hypothetical protein
MAVCCQQQNPDQARRRHEPHLAVFTASADPGVAVTASIAVGFKPKTADWLMARPKILWDF